MTDAVKRLLDELAKILSTQDEGAFKRAVSAIKTKTGATKQ